MHLWIVVFHSLSLSVHYELHGHETLPMMRFGPLRKILCWSSTSGFGFCNISSMQRLLNPILNVVNYCLWVILKSDLAFCFGFVTYHNQFSFFPLNVLQLVWFGCGLPPLHVSIIDLFQGFLVFSFPVKSNWSADTLNNTLFCWWDQRSSLNVRLHEDLRSPSVKPRSF